MNGCLQVISLAWLGVYYVQRFRYASVFVLIDGWVIVT